MKFRAKVFFFLIPVLVITLSSANAQQAVPEKDKYGGTLSIAIRNDFKSLDARYGGLTGSDNRGQIQLYNRLVEEGPNGLSDLIPSLATDWKQIDDVTWLVHIRKGVKFHSGKELTASDVAKNYDWRINAKKYTKEKGWRPPRGRTQYFQIKNVEALDKHTLKFTLKFPFVLFVGSSLAKGTRSGIIDPDIVEKYGKQATSHPVGTGPFKFVEYVSGSHLIFERFEEFWGQKPYLERIIFRIIPDNQTRFIALQKGEVDIATDLLYSQIPLMEKDPNLKYNRIVDARRASWGNVWFNHRRWPTNQLKFRQAIAMGVDWRGIAKALFPPAIYSPRYTFLEGSWWENKEAKKLVPEYDVQKAKQLLAEVEKEAGKPLPSSYLAIADDGHQGTTGGLLTIAAEKLKQIGVNLRVQLLPEEVQRDRLRRDPKSDWDIAIASFVSPGVDPGETMSTFYSKAGDAADGSNVAGFMNSGFDELYLKGGATFDTEERKKIYQEMEKIMLKNLVIYPVFNYAMIHGYNRKVHDFPEHDSGFIYFFTPWNNMWLEKE